MASRIVTHPRVMAALAAEDLLESYGRTIPSGLTNCPKTAVRTDAILLSAAKAGMDLRDLAGLAAEMYQRSRQDLPDRGAGRKGSRDEAVHLQTTFPGCGSPQRRPHPRVRRGRRCGAGRAVGSRRRRGHRAAIPSGTISALQEAMRRLLAAACYRAGRPAGQGPRAHLPRRADADWYRSSALMDRSGSPVPGAVGSTRAAASDGTSDGGAWLDGETAVAFTCDALTIPVVTGDVNLGALEDLIRLCTNPASSIRMPPPTAPDIARRGRAGAGDHRQSRWTCYPAGRPGELLLRQQQQLGARLGGPSLPLDVGVSADIPAAIRRAVILRDQHCRFPGGCDQPAARCEVHHLRHRANGGRTGVESWPYFVSFTTRLFYHQWGWTVVLNPNRDDHSLEQGQDQDHPQPQPTCQTRLSARRAPAPPTVRHQSPDNNQPPWSRHGRRCSGSPRG